MKLAKTKRDLGNFFWNLLVNKIAASTITPRVVRSWCYKVARLPIETTTMMSGITITARNLTIGQDTFVNGGCYFEGIDIVIGQRCQIGMQVLFTTAHHERDDRGRILDSVRRGITVGDDCWIGARAILLPGVSVGHGVTVGAGSVVTRDLVDPGVYAGAPARQVSARIHR